MTKQVLELHTKVCDSCGVKASEINQVSSSCLFVAKGGNLQEAERYGKVT